MKTAIVAGATGLIGKELVQKLIQSDEYRLIYLISRRSGDLKHTKIRELVVDFDHLSQLNMTEPIDEAFCALGTTMKHAGTRENFKKVDYQYILEYAALTKRCGVSKFLVISSMGAGPKSPAFYNRVKGMTEEALKNLGFDQLIILRPSLLLGDRPEFRWPEKLAGFVMKALNFLIPDNFKAISGEKVAGYMLKMAHQQTKGVKIIESGEMRLS